MLLMYGLWLARNLLAEAKAVMEERRKKKENKREPTY